MKVGVLAVGRWADGARAAPVYLLALAVPWSMALTSLAKALVLLTALVLLVGRALAVRGGQSRPAVPWPRATGWAIAASLAALALSLAYTTAPADEALRAWVKYGKLLIIPLCVLLLRTPGQAWTALALHLASQTVVLAHSLVLGTGVELPWLPEERNAQATVATSYLDQSIMTVGLAAVCWHLRAWATGPWRTALLVVAALAAVNVLLQLPGRSGHASLLVVIGMACWWHWRGRLRATAVGAALLAPLAVVAGAMAASPQLADRLTAVYEEAVAWRASSGTLTTSSGLRLHLWSVAADAVAQQPVTGYGVGAWSTVYRAGNRGRDALYSGRGGNPHQEYLLWAVHLGVGGLALLLALLAALARDAAAMPAPLARAALSVLAMLAVSSLFNCILYDALIGDYFCMLLGVLLALGRRVDPHRCETQPSG